MKPVSKLFFFVASIYSLSLSIALSCGPIFPWQLLDNRTETLQNLEQTNSFANRVKKLITIDKKEQSYFLYNKNTPTNNTPTTSTTKTCPNTNDAYEQAAKLFHNQQWDAAYNAFTLLSYNSPPPQQVCARYTLARIESILGKSDDAEQSFASTAYLVSQGAPDPLHLGLSAYGEEAGLILDHIGKRVRSQNGGQTIIKWEPNVPQSDSFFLLKQALHLYALQAALGDDGGVYSIRIVLQGLLLPSDPAKAVMKNVVSDSFLRKLLIAYALGDENLFDNPKKQQTRILLLALVQASSQETEKDNNFSELALLSYQNGEIDLAQQFAEKDWEIQQKAVDAWLLAKIALIHKKIELAQQFYHQAITHFNDNTLQSSLQNRLNGEQALLTLSQGNFLQAMEQLWPAREIYWGDIAYLAENVLTIQELKEFTDHHTFAQPQSNILNKGPIIGLTGAEAAIRLRNLLARRLVRKGLYDQAALYFTVPDTLAVLRKYQQNLDNAQHSFWATNRAEAFWNAAKIMKNNGMELSGTETYPDQLATDGAFPNGFGQFKGPKSLPENAPWSTIDEQKRVDSSWPIPNRRFHYRYTAVTYVLHAAELIPPQSQAYAALLCNATEWMLNTSNYEGLSNKEATPLTDSLFAQAKAQDLYHLYLQNGAIVPFASHFGHSCPQPNFLTIEKTKQKLFWEKIRLILRPLKNITQKFF